MAVSELNIAGLNDEFVRMVTESYQAFQEAGTVRIVIDGEEIEGFLAEVAAAGINIFDQNLELLNVLESAGCWLLQVKGRWFVQTDYSYRGSSPLNATGYAISELGYQKLSRDYGIIRIHPAGGAPGLAAKLLRHVFSSDDFMVSGHEEFSKYYEIHATRKPDANIIISDKLLDAVACCPNFQVSVVHDRLVIWNPQLTDVSAKTIIGIFHAFQNR